jgi:APA family basic amino acid/polyamine antiporter
MAAVAVTFARYFREISGCGWSDGAIAATTLLLLTAINCMGVRWGSNVQSALMVLKSAAIAGMVVLGLALGGGHIHPLPLLDQPVSFGLIAAIGAAMTPVACAYGGWQTASFVAEEMKDSRRDLSRGLLLGVSGVIVLYLSANFVCLKVLGPSGLAATRTPASAVMRAALGDSGALWIAVGIAVSTLGFLSQSILTAPRVYYAMAKDGLFFSILGRLSPRTAVPAVAVDFILFALVAASLFVFRHREGGVLPKGVHGVPGHPYTTALFVAACVGIVASTVWNDPVNSAKGWLILLTGIPVYLYWSRRRTET